MRITRHLGNKGDDYNYLRVQAAFIHVLFAFVERAFANGIFLKVWSSTGFGFSKIVELQTLYSTYVFICKKGKMLTTC